MRYYVAADPHGFYSHLHHALTQAGFFEDPQPHKLILCGDVMDRGQEAVKMQEFILELLRKEQVILIRGNHEDLAEDLLYNWHLGSFLERHHRHNGTIDTVLQLTNTEPIDFQYNSDRIGRRFQNTPYIQRIIPETVDYFETERYIFVHGWVPVGEDENGFFPLPNWRQADREQWYYARWANGMAMAHGGATVPGKTVVCGHFRCSYGHAHYEDKGSEFDADADFTPYYAPGIIALDACTALSGKVNCIVLED